MVQAADNACYLWYVVGSLWSIALALRLRARITSSDHYNEPQGDSSYKQTSGKYFYFKGAVHRTKRGASQGVQMDVTEVRRSRQNGALKPCYRQAQICKSQNVLVEQRA